MDVFRKKSLQDIDENTSFLRGTNLYIQHPPMKWIKAIRLALGMTSQQLANRMGVSRARVSALENSEGVQPITTESLERAATALGCRLVYAFVPEENLIDLMEKQAEAKAALLVDEVQHSMFLEDQATDEENRQEIIEEIKERLLNNPQKEGLWDE